MAMSVPSNSSSNTHDSVIADIATKIGLNKVISILNLSIEVNYSFSSIISREECRNVGICNISFVINTRNYTKFLSAIQDKIKEGESSIEAQRQVLKEFFMSNLPTVSFEYSIGPYSIFPAFTLSIEMEEVNKLFRNFTDSTST